MNNGSGDESINSGSNSELNKDAEDEDFKEAMGVEDEKRPGVKKDNLGKLKNLGKDLGGILKKLFIYSRKHPKSIKFAQVLLAFFIPLFAYMFYKWVGLFVGLIFVVLLFRRAFGGKLIPVAILMAAIILFYVLVHPAVNLSNYFARTSPLQGPSFWGQTHYGTKKINTGIFEIIHQTQLNLARQVQCAEGMCPQGKVDGPSVGMSLSSPSLLYQMKPIIGDKLYFSSVIQGYNLNVYPKVVIHPHCYVDKAETKAMPEEIPFTDISNYQQVVRCAGVTQPNSYFVNDLKVVIDFNFTTQSDLRLFIMDDQTRSSLMITYGPEFMDKVFGLQGTPVARYNDGPINLGMKVTQYPIAARSDESATLIFALTNQWKGLHGKLINISSMKIIVPEGVSLLTEKEVCPFEKVSYNTYALEKGFKFDKPVTGVRNFFCGIKVNTKKNPDYPVWMPHLRVIANYTYEMSSTSEIPVRRNKDKNSFEGGDSSSGGRSSSGNYNDAGVKSRVGEILTSDCNSYKPTDVTFSSYEQNVLVRYYENNKPGAEIKAGLARVIPKYDLPGFSDLDMESLLLAIMSKETSMGSAGDDDGDGTADHIAGCDVYDKYYHPDNIEENILCAAITLNNWYKSKTCDYNDVNKRLACTLHAYNKGPNGASNTQYINQVETFMEKWKNYLCANK